MTRSALFVSWSVAHGRSRDLATALGAEAVFIGVRRRRRRWLSPLRYVASAVVTLRLLVARRPRALFVMVPPLPLTVMAVVYGRLTRTPVVLDAHTGAALSMRTGRRRLSLRWAGRLATVTIVTNEQLAGPLRASGVRTITLHDAVGTLPGREGSSFTVVAPLSWAPDEPVEQIVAAAQRCPDVAFVATGRAPQEMIDRPDLPTNLDLVGFLEPHDFDALLETAGVVLALTTREATMQRAGYEAMARGRPVIASRTQVLREFFREAALYAADSEELAAAVLACQERHDELVVAMQARRVEVQAEFARAIEAIRDATLLPA